MLTSAFSQFPPALIVKPRPEPSLAELRKHGDEELIHRYVNRREQGAFHCLYDRYSHLVLGVCFKYLDSREAAQDATQQIFVKLLTDLQRFKIENFRPWLMQVARNHCLMQLRKANVIVSADLETAGDMESDDSWHQDMSHEELLTGLEAALTELNAEQRICIERFYLQRQTYATIADATGYTMLQVKSYIQNGKRNLKNKILAARAAGKS